MEKIIESDGLVIGTPVYLNNMSGILKTFISFKELYTYNIQRALATNIFPLDKDYWENKNWINNPYFPQAKLNSIQKMYGNGIYKLLHTVIKPLN